LRGDDRQVAERGESSSDANLGWTGSGRKTCCGIGVTNAPDGGNWGGERVTVSSRAASPGSARASQWRASPVLVRLHRLTATAYTAHVSTSTMVPRTICTSRVNPLG